MSTYTTKRRRRAQRGLLEFTSPVLTAICCCCVVSLVAMMYLITRPGRAPSERAASPSTVAVTTTPPPAPTIDTRPHRDAATDRSTEPSPRITDPEKDPASRTTSIALAMPQDQAETGRRAELATANLPHNEPMAMRSSPAAAPGARGEAGGPAPEQPAIHPLVRPWSVPRTATRSNYTGGLSTLDGIFEIPTRVAGVPYVLCSYAIPMTGATPAPTSPDIILRFGWIGQDATEECRHFAVRYGFTVITLKWPRQNGVKVEDAERFSIYPQSGSGEAWNTAIRCVRQLARLPERRVFVLGFSAGASAAQQYTEFNADQVEAQVIIAGRTFTPVVRFPRPSLVMHSYEDAPEENRELIEKLGKAGSHVTHLTFPPNWTGRGKNALWKHNGDGNSWSFANEWLASVADLRQRNGGQVPPPAQWVAANGLRIPAQQCASTLRTFLQVPAVSRDGGTGTQITITEPGLNASDKAGARGTVFWIDRRAFASPDDIAAPAQLLAAQGYRCAAAIFDNDQTSALPVLQAMKSRIKIIRPACLVLVGPATSDLDMLPEVDQLISSAALIHLKESQLPALSTVTARTELRLVLQAGHLAKERMPLDVQGNRLVKWMKPRQILAVGDQYAWNLESALSAVDPDQFRVND